MFGGGESAIETGPSHDVNSGNESPSSSQSSSSSSSSSSSTASELGSLQSEVESGNSKD
jgi:hypothetical protein